MIVALRYWQAMVDLKMNTEAANKKASENKKKHDEELAKERQRQAEIHESLKDRVDERAVENERLRQKLSPLRMSVHEVFALMRVFVVEGCWMSLLLFCVDFIVMVVCAGAAAVGMAHMFTGIERRQLLIPGNRAPIVDPPALVGGH
jgi:hypothetical protein